MKLSRLILRQQLGSALQFCCNKSPRQRNVPSDLTLHFRVGGYQFSSIYVIVFKSLRLQRVHTYPDSLRFQKFPLWRPFSKVCGYRMRFRRIRVDAKRNRNKMLADTNESGYVWTGPKYPCGISNPRRWLGDYYCLKLFENGSPSAIKKS